ncbi:MAG: hypothetical protein A2W80_15425 [Candidatus Riflebacteria bacterium GWC2_50_8]|nr:MAG: hypothetical protein A2W80_15425 [Candidatus Riflebacteria bacterium GWC2_50_8]
MLSEKFLKRGITLIEIVMAMLIMASVMIPVASIMGYGGRATVKDARRIAAIQLLEKTMRVLLQEDFAAIPTGNSLQASFGNVVLGNITSDAGTVYTVSLDSEFISPAKFAFNGVNVNSPTFKTDEPAAEDFMTSETLSLNNCVKQVRITVRWMEQQTTPVEIAVISYRADFTRRTG